MTKGKQKKKLTLDRSKELDKSKIPFKDKVKCSYYLNKSSEIKIAKICINRMEHGGRSSKSGIVDEAIDLLYNKECENDDGKK